MRRVAIFASYSDDGTLKPYVEYYLEGLKKVCDDIIFIADSDMKPEYEEKLKKYWNKL